MIYEVQIIKIRNIFEYLIDWALELGDDAFLSGLDLLLEVIGILIDILIDKEDKGGADELMGLKYDAFIAKRENSIQLFHHDFLRYEGTVELYVI